MPAAMAMTFLDGTAQCCPDHILALIQPQATWRKTVQQSAQVNQLYRLPLTAPWADPLEPHQQRTGRLIWPGGVQMGAGIFRQKASAFMGLKPNLCTEHNSVQQGKGVNGFKTSSCADTEAQDKSYQLSEDSVHHLSPESYQAP